MANLQFPSEIRLPSYPFNENPEDPAITSKMENGWVVSRARFTRIRDTFDVQWSSLPDNEYQILKSFYKTQALGGSVEFDWIHPVTKEVKTVRFTSFKPSMTTNNFWSVQVTLQES